MARFCPTSHATSGSSVANARNRGSAGTRAIGLLTRIVAVPDPNRDVVSAATAMILGARRPVLPDYTVLETTQDRLAEKDFVTGLGIATARYADVSSAVGLRAAVARHNARCPAKVALYDFMAPNALTTQTLHNGSSASYVDLVHFRPPAGLWLLRQMGLNIQVP